jgi:hypothetical protein
MESATAFPFARAAAALAAYERNARDAARWAHASWFGSALRIETRALDLLRQAIESAGRKEVDLCSRALLRAAGVTQPGFGVLRASGPALLCVRYGCDVRRLGGSSRSAAGCNCPSGWEYRSTRS